MSDRFLFSCFPLQIIHASTSTSTSATCVHEHWRCYLQRELLALLMAMTSATRPQAAEVCTSARTGRGDGSALRTDVTHCILRQRLLRQKERPEWIAIPSLKMVRASVALQTAFFGASACLVTRTCRILPTRKALPISYLTLHTGAPTERVGRGRKRNAL
jgi:hypothetical protein